jgi:hypothetical protein
MFSIKKETNICCDFPNKYVLKPFNGISINEEHLNNFVQLTKKNPASTKRRRKNLDQKNDNKNIIKYKKDIEDIAKHACNCYKTLCFTFQIRLISKLYFNNLSNDF